MVKQSIAFMVTSPPHDNYTATAIQFISAALSNNNIDVLGVFFYQNGVLNGSNVLTMPSDELQAIKQWQALHKQYNLPLHLCITAAEKRGLSDEINIAEHPSNISDCFTISGLGELVELTTQADRFIQL